MYPCTRSSHVGPAAAAAVAAGRGPISVGGLLSPAVLAWRLRLRIDVTLPMPYTAASLEGGEASN